MEFYLEVEARELLCDFESAYSTAWETCEQIEQYIDRYYGGDVATFIYEVAHNCDYFSIAPILQDFISQKRSS